MFRPTPTRLLLAALPLFMVGTIAGCTSNDYADMVPLTESDAAQIEADRMQEKQGMLARAEELVRDGEAESARGQAMVSQGNTVKGQPMVASGNAKIAQGNALRDMANKIDTDVEPIEVQVGQSGSTRSSN